MTITGDHFLKYNVDDDDDEDGGEATFYFLHENETQSNDTLASVTGHGKYDVKTIDDDLVSRVGPSFAAHLHKGKCEPSVDDCELFPVDLPASGEQLSIEWKKCVEGVVHLDPDAEPEDAPHTYDLYWPENQIKEGSY